MNEKDEKNIENLNLDKSQDDKTISEDVVNEDQTTPEEQSSDINNEEKNQELVIQDLQDDILQLRDEKLRVLAEMENLRKRSDRDRIDSIRYGSMNLARDMLSPDDNLTRALDSISNEEEKSETVKNLIDGLMMVQKEFAAILDKHGVKKINALNQKFDHNFHQAMLEVEDSDVDEGVIVQEIQSGYTMHDKLLRPSMVGVSKKPKKDK